MVDAPVFKVKH